MLSLLPSKSTTENTLDHDGNSRSKIIDPKLTDPRTSNSYTQANDENDNRSVNLLFDSSDDSESTKSSTNKSIDSDETEDPQYPWDTKATNNTDGGKRSIEIETKTKPPTIQESPTTKTLNSFSQNMDDLLQCDKPYIGNKKESARPSLAKKPPPPNFVLPRGYDRDWEIHPVRIESSPTRTSSTATSSSSQVPAQSLGMVIARAAFPMIANGERRAHCLVKRLHDGGIASRCGFQPGDWFLSPMDVTGLSRWSKGESSSTIPREESAAIRKYETDGPLELASFEEIQTWSKEASYRPIRVLRKRTETNDKARPASKTVGLEPATEPDKMSNRMVPTTTAKRMAPKLSRDKESRMKGNSVSDRIHSHNHSNASVPPYCVLCNYYNPDHWSEKSTYGNKRTKPKRAPRNHHTWCPKHKAFDAERVPKRLARMKHCYRILGCEACHMEYQTGKVISAKKKAVSATGNNQNADALVHNTACLQYQEALRKEAQRKQQEEEERERKEQEKRNEQKAALKKQARAEAKKRTAISGGTRKKLRSNRSDNRRVRAVASGYDSSSSSSDDFGCEDGSIYQPPTRKAKMEHFSYPKQRRDDKSNKAISSSRKKQDSKKNPSNDIVNEEFLRFGGATNNMSYWSNEEWNLTFKEEENHQLEWVPMEDNPWGEEGYKTGDVLLFGQQLGMGHIEMILPCNPRYRVEPFGEDSTYCNTHCIPKEGLSIIYLKRDPMGNMPWGFEPIRDEFGYACLVKSVDPCSPASAATLVGVPTRDLASSSMTNASSNGLKVNDMIIMVNGKPVGGMTEEALQIELRTTRSNLFLAVSRYKHAETLARKISEMEQNVLDFMDRVGRDHRMMGWQEIGCGDVPDTKADEDIAVSNHESADTRLSHMGEIKQGCIQQESLYENKLCNESDTHEDSATAAKHTSLEFPSANDGNESDRSLLLIQKPTNKVSIAHQEVNSSQQPALTNKKSIASDVSRNVSESEKPKPPSSLNQSNSPNFTRMHSPISAEEGHRSVPTPPRDTLNSAIPETDRGLAVKPTLPNGQREKNHATPRAVRELESYNRNGLKYWETFESMQLPGNPDRALRKRRVGMNKHDQRHSDRGRGVNQALLSTKPKKKNSSARSNTEEGKPRSCRKDKPQRLSKGKHSNKTRVKSKTLSVDSSVKPMVASGKPEGDTTIDSQDFNVGDLVYVESHAWAYVNNSGGIGMIQKAYVSEHGERVYDVKYPALDRTEKGILAEFISSYCFD